MSHNFELKKPVECIGEFKPHQIQMPVSEGINVTDSSHPSAPNNLFTSLYSKIGIRSNKWMDLACNLATESAKTGGGPFAAILLQVDDSTNRILRYWTGNNLVTLLTTLPHMPKSLLFAVPVPRWVHINSTIFRLNRS